MLLLPLLLLLPSFRFFCPLLCSRSHLSLYMYIEFVFFFVALRCMFNTWIQFYPQVKLVSIILKYMAIRGRWIFFFSPLCSQFFIVWSTSAFCYMKFKLILNTAFASSTNHRHIILLPPNLKFIAENAILTMKLFFFVGKIDFSFNDVYHFRGKLWNLWEKLKLD